VAVQPWVNVYVPLDGVGSAKERVTCDFTDNSFDLKVRPARLGSARLSMQQPPPPGRRRRRRRRRYGHHVTAIIMIIRALQSLGGPCTARGGCTAPHRPGGGQAG
jgi:hypothetical protein